MLIEQKIESRMLPLENCAFKGQKLALYRIFPKVLLKKSVFIRQRLF